MSTEFRTNRETRNVFPTARTSPRGIREFERFRMMKLSQDRSQWREIAGYPNWDTYETALILENDQRSYRWLQSWGENWARKMKSGRYNRDAAEYAVWKYIIPAARGKGFAQNWKAGIAYNPDGSRYHEDEFVGDEEIDRDNVDYGFLVDRINEQWADHVAYEAQKTATAPPNPGAILGPYEKLGFKSEGDF